MTKIQEDCYFYIDSLHPKEEKYLLAKCIDCQKDNNDGWFWDGSKRGYGQDNISCNICGRFIYKNEEEAKEDSKS